MKKLFDLRFVIGAFFFVVGWMLLLYYLVNKLWLIANDSVNLWCGLVFILFGSMMILLSYGNKPDDE
ncbi:MAG: hypothetical protein KGO92_10420 [Bacteroidota bacterium]|nr:hypothetical protein [Bacteroidota bacterium]